MPKGMIKELDFLRFGTKRRNQVSIYYEGR
jgi:hypothetical protein